MGKVDLDINRRKHAVGCEDGQEDHIRQLGRHVDQHVKQLARSLGDLGETRLLLMAALMITDELYDARKRIDELVRAQVAPPAPVTQPALESVPDIARAIDLFEHATERIERLRRTIEGADGSARP